MFRQSSTRLFFAAALFIASGCDSEAPKEEETPPDTPETLARATWHQDVAPIIHSRCVGCHHSPGGIAPFGLETFDEAGPIAGLLLQAIEDGAMPPWSAVAKEECVPEHGWKNDARVSASELVVLQQWLEDGAVEGDVATAAVLPERKAETLEDVSHELAMTPYVTTGTEDELVCFVLDPGLTALTYVTGVEVVPKNLEVAHHAVLTVVPAAGAQEIRDRVGPDGSFECGSGVGIPNSYPLGVWVPGAVPLETPDGSSTPIAPGSIVVLQMHYHPTGIEHEPDQTKVRLRTVEEKPERTFLFTVVGNAAVAPQLLPGDNDPGGIPRFVIPANVDNHRETMEFKLDLPNLTGQYIPIVSLIPHMHYVGVDMEVQIHRENPPVDQSTDECIINVKDWDFDWQRTYNYDASFEELPTLTDGDTITLKCDYNNTMANPFVQRMLAEEGLNDPIDIRLGEETTDEMCIAIMGLVF